jgi:hypothetical protein
LLLQVGRAATEAVDSTPKSDFNPSRPLRISMRITPQWVHRRNY